MDAIEHAVKSFVTLNPRGGGRASVLSAVPEYGTALKSRIRTEVNVLRNESKMPKLPVPIGIMNITATHGGVVALGDVVSSTILTVNRSGADDELKSGLARLSKAIQDSDALARETQVQVLESLDFIARQMSIDPSQRRSRKLFKAYGFWLQNRSPGDLSI